MNRWTTKLTPMPCNTILSVFRVNFNIEIFNRQVFIVYKSAELRLALSMDFLKIMHLILFKTRL